jgi:AraC-like DNA-binding protein|nr:AraC family transcriptional regulator [Kofleriaceae bacterium]
MARGVLLHRLVRARELMHASPADPHPVDALARAAGLSRAHFAREFAGTFGVAPHQYLVQLRLDAAKRALASGDRVTDVCLDLGFASLGTFSTAFHRRTGLTPRAWQKRARPFVQSLGLPRLVIPACFLPAHV